MASIWMEGPVAASFPPLSGNTQTEVVVVGGGLTGLLTAWNLNAAGRRVIVLEAARIGAGNTAGSTGNLYATVSKGLASLRKKWSAEQVRAVVELRAAAVERLARHASELGLGEHDFVSAPLTWAVMGTDEKQLESLDEEADASREAWLDVVAVDGRLPFSPTHAFALARQAQCNPYALATALAAALQERGVEIHEHSRVIDADASEGTVQTDAGAVKAEQLVFATHTPIGFNLVQAEMEVYREWGIAVPARSGLPQGVFWWKDRGRSLRRHVASGEEYLVVIGEKHKTGAPIEGDYFERLAATAASIGATQAPTHRWSAQQFAAADGLPYIGRSAHDNVFVATGFGADGLTWGTVAAQLIAELIGGSESSAIRLLSPRRFTPIKSAEVWARENAAVIKHLTVDYLKRAEGEAADLAPGEGRIVEVDGHSCAAYRDAGGQVTLLSCVCPHLKCKVAWNGVDRTWDCPCHGSRFQVTGEVIEGPAWRGLERIG
jgi:glycine/D-amino acid oxidase-like deaminating enzyme/nitrite reductase/ring-hydroxylating ferredoxin subunit